MLSVDGDADAAVEANRCRAKGWNNLRQLVPLLTGPVRAPGP